MEEAPVFRANKRRKLARQKDEEPHTRTRPLSPRLSEGDTGDDGNQDVDVSELLRLRRQNRPRITGVQFMQHKRADAQTEESEDMTLVKANPDEERLKDVSNRFVGSTGQVVDVDKHMMAYIDSEMAKRQTTASQAEAEFRGSQSTDSQVPSELRQSDKSQPEYPSQPQLAEFDLGPDAYEKNLSRTEAAIVRAQSGLPPPVEDSRPRRPHKPRLGRDGKPFRPRPRKGRDSGDVARDALVEQMLHEHRMDVYEAEQGSEPATHGSNVDADEQLAEQFKQEFLDAMAERQQKHNAKATTVAKAKGTVPDIASGPKLGGGRTARAKMAQLQLQQLGQSKGPSG